MVSAGRIGSYARLAEMLRANDVTSLTPAAEPQGGISCDRGTVEPFWELVYRRIKETCREIADGSRLSAPLRRCIERDWAKKRGWLPAVLPLLTCRLVGGDEEAAIHLAVAWNLLHLAAHMLDDVEEEQPLADPDGAMSIGQAVNVATALLFLAQRALDPLSEEVSSILTHRLRSELNRTVVQMCEGQHLDLIEATNPSFGLDAYWQVVGAKSGGFFAWACRAGAVLGGGNPSQVDHCGSYGYNLGVLVQIADDWADVWPGEGVSDLARGKKTLPVLYALRVAPPGRRERLMAWLEEARRSRGAEAEARAEIIRLGGLHYVLAEAQVRRRRARNALQAFPASSVRDRLLSFLDAIFRVGVEPTKPGGEKSVCELS